MSNEIQVQVQASNVRPTTMDVERGVDLDVRVTLPDGRTVSGEVTLLPAEDGRAAFASWGDSSNWISPALLAELYAAYEDDRDGRRDALTTLAIETSAAVGGMRS